MIMMCLFALLYELFTLSRNKCLVANLLMFLKIRLCFASSPVSFIFRHFPTKMYELGSWIETVWTTTQNYLALTIKVQPHFH